jgi:hypothetical protein
MTGGDAVTSESQSDELGLIDNAKYDPQASSRLSRLSQTKSSDYVYIPYLSATHNEIINDATKYPPDAGTKHWRFIDAVGYKLGKDIFPFKDQWVKGYRNAI